MSLIIRLVIYESALKIIYYNQLLLNEEKVLIYLCILFLFRLFLLYIPNLEVFILI